MAIISASLVKSDIYYQITASIHECIASVTNECFERLHGIFKEEAWECGQIQSRSGKS